MKHIDKTKREFEKALLTLLEEKNYRDITINEICASVNKTKMTFYHYYKNKENLLTQASINLVNSEYSEEYNKILRRETDLEEIEYQATLATYELVAKHYTLIQNLIYKGDTLPLEIFKGALLDNYSKYMAEMINANGFDIPCDYLSIFCFEGLYGSCLYYAEQLKNSRNKTKVREDIKKICRLLAKFILLIEKTN